MARSARCIEDGVCRTPTVVPACITGTRYDPGVCRPFFRRYRAWVRFGKPLDLALFSQVRPTRETYRQVTALMVEAIDALRG